MKNHIVTYSLENKNIMGRLAILFLTLMLSLTSYGQNTQNVQSILTESWIGGITGYWQNLNKNIYSYDSNGYMTNDLKLKWDIPSSTMQNLTQNNYVNNPNGTVSQKITQSWDNVSGSWGNSDKYSYTYNSSNNVQSLLQESWTNGNWQNVNMTTYTYTDSHLTNSLTQRWDVPSLSWLITSQINYTYDSNGNVTIMTNQTYTNNTWKDYMQHTYTYNTQNLVLIDHLRVWDNIMWRSTNKYENSYASGILYNTVIYSYPAANQSAYLSGQNNYTNNSNGTVNQLVSQTWNATSYNTGYYINYRRLTYNYDPELDITDFENQNSVTIYPNPTTNILNIETKESIEKVSLKVYNITGQMVININKAENISSIDVTNLKTGNYFIVIQTDKGIYKSKFIKN